MERTQTPPPYTCKFCGQPSYIHPTEQEAPPDYCHESDHGQPEDIEPAFDDAADLDSDDDTLQMDFIVPSRSRYG